MKYVIRTYKNDNGNEVVYKEKEGSSIAFYVCSSEGKNMRVNKSWLLSHRNDIENMGVKSDGSIYCKSKHQEIPTIIKGFWNYCNGDGKQTIHTTLKSFFGDDKVGTFDKLKQNGYDGLIILNAPVGVQNKMILKAEIVAFYPNQIKRMSNLFPTDSNSVSDLNSKGNRVCQEEYFKNSKIRSKQGRLLKCYHCTTKDFDEFRYDLIGSGSGCSYGDGFYFASEPIGEYGKPMVVFLNITRPYVIKDLNDFNEIATFLLACGVKDEE